MRRRVTIIRKDISLLHLQEVSLRLPGLWGWLLLGSWHRHFAVHLHLRFWLLVGNLFFLTLFIFCLHLWTNSLLIILKLQTLENVWVYFFVDRGLSLILLLQALVGTHPNEFLAWWLIWSSLMRVHLGISLVPWRPILRRRHKLCFLIRRTWLRLDYLLSRICFWWLVYVSIVIHPFLDKLVELIDRDVFKRAIFTLTHEPDKNLLIGILLSLVVGQVESIARLFVEGSQSIGRIDEAVLQWRQMSLRGRASYHRLWMDFLALGLRYSIRVQMYGLLRSTGMNLLVVDLSTDLSKSVNSSLRARVIAQTKLVITLALILSLKELVLLLIVCEWWILHLFFLQLEIGENICF